jgi:hypothetical protein
MLGGRPAHPGLPPYRGQKPVATQQSHGLSVAHPRGSHLTGTMTPLERLHMTALVTGPADQFSQDQLGQMIKTASVSAADRARRALAVDLGGN